MNTIHPSRLRWLFAGLLLSYAASQAGAMAWAAMPGFRWVVNAGGSDDDLGNAAAVDSAGNTIVVGLFNNVADFGGSTLTSRGMSDIFVASYDPDGKLRWVRQAGGADVDEGKAVAVDQHGNVFWAGTFRGSARLNTASFIAVGEIDFVVAKHSPQGDVQWIQPFGGKSKDIVHSLAVDNAGHCYVTGSFSGALKMADIALASEGDSDIFVVKLDPAGKPLWAVSGGGPLRDEGRGIAVDKKGNVAVVGEFRGRVQFLSEKVISAGAGDMFFASLDAMGQLRWFRHAGGFDPLRPDLANRVAADEEGNSYVAGSYAGEVFFDGTRVSSRGGYDVFTAKYDRMGKLVWVRTGGGPGDDRGDSIGLDAAGNVYAAGLIINSAEFGNVRFATSGNSDVYVLKYDNEGNLTWGIQSGASGYTTGLGLGVNSEGVASVTGYFRGATMFGGFWLNNAPGRNIYVARIEGPPKLSVRRNGGTVTVTWPRAAAGYQLESARELVRNAPWSSTTAGPITMGDQNAVSVDANDGARVFRLRRP